MFESLCSSCTLNCTNFRYGLQYVLRVNTSPIYHILHSSFNMRLTSTFHCLSLLKIVEACSVPSTCWCVCCAKHWKNGILLLRQLFLIFNHCFFLLFSPLPRVNSLHMPVDTKKNENMAYRNRVCFFHSRWHHSRRKSEFQRRIEELCGWQKFSSSIRY